METYSGVQVLEVLREAKNYNDYLMSLIEKRRRSDFKIMDFGAGVGTFALPLLKKGADVICIEPDLELGARLRNAGATVATGLSDIRDESLDMIYTFNVLEHIPDDNDALRILATKLRPHGILLIYVPAFMVLYSSFDRDIGHLRRYRRGNLMDLVNAAGLRVIEARYADSAGFMAALAYRLLGLGQGSVRGGAVKFYDRIIFPLSRIGDMALDRWIGKNLVLVAEKDVLPSSSLRGPPTEPGQSIRDNR